MTLTNTSMHTYHLIFFSSVKGHDPDLCIWVLHKKSPTFGSCMMISESVSYSYRKTISNLATKLEEYWNEIRHKRMTEDPNSIPAEDALLVHFGTA